MLEQMKKIARQSGEEAVPVRIMFGQVTGASPLKIMVDNRFEIKESAIILLGQFRSGSFITHTHTVPGNTAQEAGGHTHAVPACTTGAEQSHSHTVPSVDTGTAGAHQHGIPQSATTAETYPGLRVGDRVALLRNHGGQEFLVLGVMR